jgi:hypothetical protein
MSSPSHRAVGPIFCICILVGIVQFPMPARAALGEDVSAIEKVRVRMGASLQVRRHPNYDIHELALPTGAMVREFVGQDAKVFAVSWSGGWRPNLRDGMGAHYDRYIEGTRGHRRARGPVRIELPGMVIFMSGHLRTFYGHVYLTEQLPAGFSLQGLE